MIEKDSIFSHYSAILNRMLDNSSFFRCFFQCPEFIDVRYGTKGDVAFPENLSIHCGCSRGCIIDDNYLDWVVKFDLADNAGYNCQREIEKYEAAKDFHVEQFFARPIYLGKYEHTIFDYSFAAIDEYIYWRDYILDNDFDQELEKNKEALGSKRKITISIDLYAYPRATTHNFSALDIRDAMPYISVYNSSPSCDIVKDVAIELIRLYGEEEYYRLAQFLSDCNINDIHICNVGDIAGKLTIIDYSGTYTFSS